MVADKLLPSRLCHFSACARKTEKACEEIGVSDSGGATGWSLGAGSDWWLFGETRANRFLDFGKFVSNTTTVVKLSKEVLVFAMVLSSTLSPRVQKADAGHRSRPPT
jgi:hypothetical protein